MSIPQDLRYGARILVRRPGFTLVALLTLTIGIGANSAIYSVVREVILKPLPYSIPQQLVQIWSQFPRMGLDRFSLSPPELFELRERNRFLQGLGGYSNGGVNLTGQGDPLRLTVSYATHGLLPMLGVPSFHGRFFGPGEDRPGQDAVVVLSYGLWQRRFGGDSTVIGRKLEMDGKAVEVVGVMPQGFGFPNPQVEAWMPLAIDPATVAERWGNHFISAVGRLGEDVSIEQASQQLSALVDGLAREAGPSNHRPDADNHPWIVRSLHEETVGEVRPQMVFLAAVVGLVLLIACVNVANLMLAHSEVRHKEMALRAALGAGRGRLFRLQMAESLILALGGGALGLLAGHWGVVALLDIIPGAVSRLDTVPLDGNVAAVTLGLSLLACLFFGGLPAFLPGTPDIQRALKETGRGSSDSRARKQFRNLLVAAEVGLAVVLVVGSGLVLRSFAVLQATDPGFQTSNALTLRTVLPDTSAEDAAVVDFYEQALQRLSALPGVASVGAQARDVLALVIRQAMLPAAWGVGIGLAAALVSAYLLRGLLGQILYRVGELDPLTYLSVVLTVTLTALASCTLPAYRASRLDPLISLRDE